MNKLCIWPPWIWEAMPGAECAVQLGCTSDLQRRSAPKAGEPNVHVIFEQALSHLRAANPNAFC